MTILAWLAVSSLVWGAVIWSVGRLLQNSGDVSGRARQWIWRGATMLLIAPWIAAPMVMAFGWGLAPIEVTPAVASTTLATWPVDEFTGEMLLDFTGAPAPAAIALDQTQMLLLVLAGGWIVRFVLAQYAAKSLLGIVAVSRPAEKGAATVALAAWTKRLGLRRAPRLRIVNEAVSPFSFGVFRPVICLPEGLEQELSREALDLVIGHECLHVARGDGWRRPLERIAADVFWFNPAAWLIRRELDVARELACDEGLVELTSSVSGARAAYARTLRDVAGFSAGLSHAAPAVSMSLAGGRSLMLRVRRTLASAKRKPARAAVVAAVLIGLLGAPIAVAQVVFVVPAPPAPPAPPAAPEAPESPAAAEIGSDGSVRATFAGKITTITGGKQNGFNVRLEGESEGAPCVADLNGLVSVDVAKGDAVTEGSLIGKRERGRNLRVSVTCTGGQQHSLAIPPAPPAAPAAVELAELAAPAPAPAPAAPAPMAAPAPKAAPSPASLPSPPSHPLPPAPMAPPASSLSPVAPVAPVAPLSPQGISYRIINAPNAVIEQSARTTSAFGVRTDPFDSKTVFHAGVDLAAPRGVTVHAPGNATVLRAEKTDVAGNVVELRTPENYIVRFGQLDEIKVKVGEQVGAGAVVGTVGSSGVSTGPHLHMEVLVDGKPVDPAQVQGLTLSAG